MTDATIEQIIGKLHEVLDILRMEFVPDADMDVTEWNETPIGRAMYRIDDVITMLEESELP